MNSESFIRSRITSSCSINDEESENENDYDDDEEEDNYLMKNKNADCTMSLNEKRKSRNQNEKKRRDRFNNLVQELSDLLSNNQKVDKTTILSETLDFFKNYNDKPLYSKEIDFRWKPFFIPNDEFMKLMIEFQNVFCLVFDLNGQIKYVSNDITHLLGHHAKNVQNCKLFDFMDEKCAKQLRNILKRKFLPFDAITFNCKFKKGDNLTYENVNVNGFFKRTPNSTESVGHFNTIARVDSFMKLREIFPSTNFKREFISELSFDFKFKSLDSKAFEIIGYSPIEVLGTSLYDLVHFDDIEHVVECHKKLLDFGHELTLVYKLLTKGQQWILIKTKFQLSGDNLRSNTIIAINRTVCLNEYLNSNKPVDQFTPIKNLSETTRKSSIEYDSMSESNKSNNFQEENENKRRKLDENKNYEKMFSKQISTPSSLSDSFSSENVSLGSNQSIRSQKPQSNLSFDESDKPALVTEFKTEKQIDKNLESIFLRSYKDVRYRSYVVNQLQLKKSNIENSIKKHQTELKVLQDTIDNINDEKLLADWVNEFQKNELNKSNLENQTKQEIKQENNDSYQLQPVVQEKKSNFEVPCYPATYFSSQTWNNPIQNQSKPKPVNNNSNLDGNSVQYPTNQLNNNLNSNFNMSNDLNFEIDTLNTDLFEKFFK